MDLLSRVKRITEDVQFYQHLSDNNFLEIKKDLLEKSEKPAINTDSKQQKYTPRSKKMNSISEGDTLFTNAFRRALFDISPFEEIIEPKISYSVKRRMDVVYESYIESMFTSKEISRMEPDIKQQVVAKIMELTELVYDNSRYKFFENGYLFEDEYETGRLKHLVENQVEAIKITAEQSTYLKETFHIFVFNSLTRLFDLSIERRERRQEACKDIFNEELVRFYAQFAKKIPWINPKIKSEIFWFYISTFSVTKERNEKDVESYKELLFCPFTTELNQLLLDGEIRLEEDNYDYMSSFAFLEEIDFVQVEKVLSTEKMESILNYLVRLYEAYYIPYTKNQIEPDDLDAELYAISLFYSFPGLKRLQTYLESKSY